VRQVDALECNSVESKQSARACHPEIAVVRLRERNRAAQWRALTGAPRCVVQLLDGQIRTERGGAAGPEQRSDREPAPLLSMNEESWIHGVILALDPLRCSDLLRLAGLFHLKVGITRVILSA
jgi:hypothetical protein